MLKSNSLLISIDSLLDERMRLVKGEKVMLDFELAELLQVSTQDLLRKVRANKDRFPGDFLIKIPANRYSIPKRRILYAFTLGGIMMAAGRFNTDRATQISIKMVEFICGRMGGMEGILKLMRLIEEKG